MNSLKHSKTKEKVILCLRKKANYQDFHCTECSNHCKFYSAKLVKCFLDAQIARAQD